MNNKNTNINFNEAVKSAKKGFRLYRTNWNIEDFIVLMPELKLKPYSSSTPEQRVNDRTAKHIGKNASLLIPPYFAKYIGCDGVWLVGWTPTAEEIMAEDWIVMANI